MKLSRNLKKYLRISAIGAVACLLGGLYALLHTPAWYNVPIIAAERRQDVRNNLLAAEQAFTESLLNSRGTFVYHTYQDDVNRWIAMRREIYPLIDELAPPDLLDPIVVFDSGEITLAGRYRKGPVVVVVSLDFSLRFIAEELLLKVEAVRCGSIRVPLRFVSIGLDRRTDRPAEATWPGSPRIWGDFMHGVHVESRAWWKNGGMEYRVRDAAVEPGMLNLTIEPLGHHSTAARNDQP